MREQNLSRGDPDSELRIARERDAAARERRKSLNQGTSPMLAAAAPAYPTSFSGYPAVSNQPANIGPYISNQPANIGPYPAVQGQPANLGPYGTTGTPGYNRHAAGGLADLNQQFADMGMADREFTVERERKPSGGLARPMKYSVPETAPERTRKLSSNFGGPYPPQPAHSIPPYPPAPGEPAFIPPYPGFARSASPMPYAANPNVYPPGHILEGTPRPPHSRSTTPLPQAGSLPASYTPSMGGGVPFPTTSVPFSQPSVGPSPRIPEQGAHQLAAPPCFSRPVNAAQSYVSFTTMKIQDMDEFLERLPRMPAVLKPHDVYVEDWNRLIQVLDLRLSPCIGCSLLS